MAKLFWMECALSTRFLDKLGGSKPLQSESPPSGLYIFARNTLTAWPRWASGPLPQT
jgi:protoporphyrinogen oxidase